MLIVHVAGKIIQMATLPPVIRIPKPVILGVDIPNDAQTTKHVDCDEYEFIGEDWKGEFYYRLVENNP